MKPKQLTVILGVLIAIIVPNISMAQDYFRQMGTRGPAVYESGETFAPEFDQLGEFSETPNYANPEEDPYNMALGPIRFNVAAGIALEYNDNIALAPDDEKESDFILRPSISLDSSWQITEMNTLHLTLGVSYAKYFDNSQYDSESVLLSPNSILAFVMRIGEVKLTISDRFSYQEDPFDLPVLSNTATYSRFENVAGIEAEWEVNEYFTLVGGYEHYNLWVFEEEFDSMDRSIDTVYLRPAYKLGPAITLGLHSSISFVKYDSGTLNDGTSWMLGPFMELALTRNTDIYLEVGYQNFDFDGDGTIDDDINDDSSSNSWYAKAAVTNQLTENFSHQLAFTKTSELGFSSNFYELYRAEYGASWAVMPSITLFPSLFYEHFNSSGDFTEEGDRFGAAAGFRYVLTPSVTLGLDYRFTAKDSNLPDADYKQNLVLLSLYYNF